MFCSAPVIEALITPSWMWVMHTPYKLSVLWLPLNFAWAPHFFKKNPPAEISDYSPSCSYLGRTTSILLATALPWGDSTDYRHFLHPQIEACTQNWSHTFAPCGYRTLRWINILYCQMLLQQDVQIDCSLFCILISSLWALYTLYAVVCVVHHC